VLWWLWRTKILVELPKEKQQLPLILETKASWATTPARSKSSGQRLTSKISQMLVPWTKIISKSPEDLPSICRQFCARLCKMVIMIMVEPVRLAPIPWLPLPWDTHRQCRIVARIPSWKLQVYRWCMEIAISISCVINKEPFQITENQRWLLMNAK